MWITGLGISEEELGTKRQRNRPQADGTNRLRRQSRSKKAENWGNRENWETGTVVRQTDRQPRFLQASQTLEMSKEKQGNEEEEQKSVTR